MYRSLLLVLTLSFFACHNKITVNSADTLPCGAELFSHQEKNIVDFVEGVRKHNPGKAIIFDVWAPWCSPCLDDMAKSKDIKKELKKLPVEVIYLCIAKETDDARWRKSIEDNKIVGKHYFLNEKLSAEIMSHYGLSGYPSFLFVDKNGQHDRELVYALSAINIEEFKKHL